MIIFFIIISISVISAEVTNDTKFIDSLPENVKKVFLAKVSRRILDEVPEVESGEATMADGEIIDAKLEEQSEFVSKILREEIDSLKARRQNSLDKFEVLGKDAQSEKNTSSKTSLETEVHINDEKNIRDSESVVGNNERHEHVDLTLRARSKRAGENVHVNESIENDNNDDIIKDEKVLNEVNQNDRIGTKISKASKINHDAKSLPLNAAVTQNTHGANSVADLNSTTMNNFMTNSFRTEHNHDSALIENENSSSEFLENNKKINETFAIKKVDFAQKPNITAIPIKILTVKSDIETRQGILTTIPSLITTTSYDVTTEIYDKVTLNHEIIRKGPGTESSKTVLRAEIEKNNVERINNTDSMKIPNSININLLKKPCNTTDTLNGTKSDWEKTNKSGNSDVAQDINSKKRNIVQVNEISLRTKKTNTLNDTKSDCAKSTNIQITKENTESVQDSDHKTKYILKEDRPSVRMQTSSSAEHFGDLRSVKYQKVHVDSKDKVEQPHSFTVYKYETDSRLGPNVDDYDNKDESSESISSLRDNLQNYNKKHSSSAAHFGDLQVATEYQVLEVDANKPSFVQENKQDNVEQPNYFLVYNYDPKNAHYNAYNRFGPNVDENVDSDDVHESNPRDAKDMINLDSAMDNGKIFEETYLEEYERSARIQPSKPEFEGYRMNELHDKFMPESYEADHPFQATQKGLKSRLEATRHILHGNKMFGYAPKNQERTNMRMTEIIGSFKEDVSMLRVPQDKEVTALKNTYVFARDHDTDKDVSNEEASEIKTKRSYPNLYSKDVPSELNVLWNGKDKIVTINGMTYNLVDGLPPSQQKDRKPNRDFLIFSDESDKLDKKSHDNIRQFIIDINRNKYDSHKSTKFNTHRERSEKNNNKKIGFERPGRNKETKAKVGKKLPATSINRFKIESRPTIDFRSQYTGEVKSEKILEQSEPYMINTIEQVINMTPEIDTLTNIEEMKEKNIPIMRSRDDDLELHVNILKDMVKMGNPALERYDWLGTTVDVLAASTKLLDLINRKESRQSIDPSDIELLKYTEAIYEAAKKFALERKEESSKLDMKEYVSRVRENNRNFPKTKKKIKNPLKVINKMYKVRGLPDKVRKEKKIPMNLEEFLTSLQNALIDFHNLINQISIITRYKNQKWYKNIKELYLVKAERKEYLEILLHLFSTRLFGLIEESSMNGANLDHEAYIKKNRAQVDRTEVEIMFLLRILEAIKNLKH